MTYSINTITEIVTMAFKAMSALSIGNDPSPLE